MVSIKQIIKNLFLSILISSLILIGNWNESIYKTMSNYDNINNNMLSFVGVMLGFTIAATPFILSVFDNNPIVKKLMKNETNREEVFKPLLQFIPIFLKATIRLFCCILVFIFCKDYYFKNLKIIFDFNLQTFFVFVLFIFYLYFVFSFFTNIYKFIKVVKIMLNFYIKEIYTNKSE